MDRVRNDEAKDKLKTAVIGCGKVHVFGSNGASVGVQTGGGSMFIAGMTGVAEPPFRDLWTVPGEEALPEQWKQEDEAVFRSAAAGAPIRFPLI